MIFTIDDFIATDWKKLSGLPVVELDFEGFTLEQLRNSIFHIKMRASISTIRADFKFRNIKPSVFNNLPKEIRAHCKTLWLDLSEISSNEKLVDQLCESLLDCQNLREYRFVNLDAFCLLDKAILKQFCEALTKVPFIVALVLGENSGLDGLPYEHREVFFTAIASMQRITQLNFSGMKIFSSFNPALRDVQIFLMLFSNDGLRSLNLDYTDFHKNLNPMFFALVKAAFKNSHIAEISYRSNHVDSVQDRDIIGELFSGLKSLCWLHLSNNGLSEDEVAILREKYLPKAIIPCFPRTEPKATSSSTQSQDMQELAISDGLSRTTLTSEDESEAKRAMALSMSTHSLDRLKQATAPLQAASVRSTPTADPIMDLTNTMQRTYIKEKDRADQTRQNEQKKEMKRIAVQKEKRETNMKNFRRQLFK